MAMKPSTSSALAKLQSRVELSPQESDALVQVDPRKPDFIPAYFQRIDNLGKFIERRPEVLARRNKYSAEQ
jgi:hypothetical protein